MGRLCEHWTQEKIEWKTVLTKSFPVNQSGSSYLLGSWKKNQPFVDNFRHSVSIENRNRTPLRFVTYITTVTTENYPMLT